MEVSIVTVTVVDRVTRRMATRDTRSIGRGVLYGDTDTGGDGASEGEGEGEDPEATVWIAPRSQVRGHSRCFHTSRECRHVDPDRFRELSRERAERRYGLDECSRCSGTASPSGRGAGHYQALLAAAEDRAPDA